MTSVAAMAIAGPSRTKPVDDDGASTVLDGHSGRERVTMREAAGQALQPGKPPGLGDQDRVEVNADKLHILAQGTRCGHRPHHETKPAAHIDDADPARAARAHRLYERAQQRGDAPAKLKLLAEPLQLPVHPQAESIDAGRIQDPVSSRDGQHDPSGSMLAAFPQRVHDIGLHRWHGRTSAVHRPQQVRNLQRPGFHDQQFNTIRPHRHQSVDVTARVGEPATPALQAPAGRRGAVPSRSAAHTSGTVAGRAAGGGRRRNLALVLEALRG